MSDEVEETEPVTVDIGIWVERARADPVAYLERQVTEVFLTALGMTHPYGHQVFLKGGILMGVVYQSPRQTGDVDFTTILDPDPGIAELIGEALDKALPRAAADLGYPELMCRVQSSKYEPSRERFPKDDGPALKLKIGYALRGSRQQANFERRRASDVLEVDISFREPVGAIQVVNFGDTGGHVVAYSLLDLMAEKLRALLQQEKRNRFRRQDIYDLDILIGRFHFDGEEKKRLIDLLMEKSNARDVLPKIDSLAQPDIVRRAREEWESLGLEVGLIPDFDGCFYRVNEFYRSLPWQD